MSLPTPRRDRRVASGPTGSTRNAVKRSVTDFNSTRPLTRYRCSRDRIRLLLRAREPPLPGGRNRLSLAVQSRLRLAPRRSTLRPSVSRWGIRLRHARSTFRMRDCRMTDISGWRRVAMSRAPSPGARQKCVRAIDTAGRTRRRGTVPRPRDAPKTPWRSPARQSRRQPPRRWLAPRARSSRCAAAGPLPRRAASASRDR